MSHPLVITFTGPDRPGIVGRLSRLVADHGGNWEESRMASLAGRFAGILEVTAPEARLDALIAALRDLGDEGFGVLVDRGDAAPAKQRRLRLELTGADHEGIVRDVSEVLASRRINIEEMTTGCSSAPMSGESLFHAVADLDCPADLVVEELRGALERLADDLVVQISLGDV